MFIMIPQESWALLSALNAVACGGAFVASRVGEPCPFCGCAAPSLLHITWTCSAISDVEDEFGFISRSCRYNHYSTWGDSWQCLWARGILPAQLLEPGPPVQASARVVSVGPFESLRSATRLSFSDGAGAPRGYPQHLRRVGAGASSVRLNEVDLEHSPPLLAELGLRFSGVLGPQTVPRAETHAAWLALPAEPSDPPPELGYDATYVGSGVQPSVPLRGSLLRGRNADLWGRLLVDRAADCQQAFLINIQSHRQFGLAWDHKDVVLWVGNLLAS